MEGHGVQTASKGLVFAMRNSELEVMSTIFFPTISQSKHWMKAPNAKDITRMAMPAPGHALLTMPNGMNLNYSLSPLISSNLSTLNLIGSSQSLGSLCMDHAFTNKIVPHGIWNPPTMQSTEEQWGNESGTVEYSRSVSLMTQWR